MKELQGTWYVISPPGNARVMVKGNRFESLGMGAVYQGTFTVDASAKPMTIDMTFTAGPEKGNVNHGIFELKGDTWRLCLNTLGKARPKKFAAAGSGNALQTLSRSPAARAASAPAAGDEWVMVSHIANGKPLEENYLPYGKRVVNGNEVTITMAGQVLVKAQFTIDGSKIDYLLKGGKKQLGIYQENGETITVNFAAPGKPRPTAFESTKSNGYTLTVWKRIKP
jgi:uncharacterized protein (TIGR03067 family)